MDASLYLGKEYNLSSLLLNKDLHWMKLFIDGDKRRRKEEERIRKEMEANKKFEIK